MSFRWLETVTGPTERILYRFGLRQSGGIVAGASEIDLFFQ
jgi:hypothetical protein